LLSVRTAPPCPDVIILFGEKDKALAIPKLPNGFL